MNGHPSRHRLRFAFLAALAAAVLLSSCRGDNGGGLDLNDLLVLTRQEGLVVRDLSSGDERVIVPTPEEAILTEPAVSHDGSQIAYVGLSSAIVIPGEPTDLGSDIYIASIDGSNPRIAVQHAIRNEQLHTPSWLPNGDLLIYSQRFENRQIVVDIERVNINTGVRTIVMNNGFDPSAAPDGSGFVFLRPEPDFTLTLWIADIDGANERQLVAGTELISFNRPRFSPDGTRIAVGATGSGEFLSAPGAPPAFVSLNAASFVAASSASALNGLPEDVWLIDVQTDEATRLADLDLDQPTPAFSGDGERLFVLADRGLFQIYLDGGERLLGDGLYHGSLDWLSAE